MGRVTFINAIVQGKVGGGVYARNRGGYYLRHFTKPLNPGTNAQLNARNNFDSAAAAWKTLTDLQRAAWNTYALTNYMPKKGYSASVTSGFNAFVALRNAALNGNRTAREITVSLPAATTNSPVAFVPPDSAPANSLGSQILDSNGDPLTITLADVVFDSATAETTVKIDFGLKQSAVPTFNDATGNLPVGFTVQLSKALNAGQTFVASPNTVTVCTIAPPVLTGTWNDVTRIEFTADEADFNINDYKLWYTTGQRCQADVYMVSSYGAMRLLGSKIITVL